MLAVRDELQVQRVERSDPSWSRLVQSSFRQFAYATLASGRHHTTLLSPGTTLGASPTRQIISRGSLLCALRDTRVRRIAALIYEKDITRQGLASGRTRPVVSNGRRRKMIRANDTSHVYGRSVTDVCKLRLVSAREEIIFLGGISSSLVGILGGSRAGEKGSGSMSLWNFKRMPAARLRNDVTKM